MKSMKLDKDKSEEMKMEVAEPSRPEYPYGLRIDLDMDCLEKLDKSLSDFKVGQELSLSAKVKVVRTDVSEQEDGEKRGSVDLQITHMDLADENSESEAFKEAFKK